MSNYLVALARRSAGLTPAVAAVGLGAPGPRSEAAQLVGEGSAEGLDSAESVMPRPMRVAPPANAQAVPSAPAWGSPPVQTALPVAAAAQAIGTATVVVQRLLAPATSSAPLAAPAPAVAVLAQPASWPAPRPLEASPLALPPTLRTPERAPAAEAAAALALPVAAPAVTAEPARTPAPQALPAEAVPPAAPGPAAMPSVAERSRVELARLEPQAPAHAEQPAPPAPPALAPQPLPPHLPAPPAPQAATAERVVQVHIGAIEIHGATPAAAAAPAMVARAEAASRAPAVTGFEAYARLRSYAPWQW